MLSLPGPVSISGGPAEQGLYCPISHRNGQSPRTDLRVLSGSTFQVHVTFHCKMRMKIYVSFVDRAVSKLKYEIYIFKRNLSLSFSELLAKSTFSCLATSWLGTCYTVNVREGLPFVLVIVIQILVSFTRFRHWISVQTFKTFRQGPIFHIDRVVPYFLQYVQEKGSC